MTDDDWAKDYARYQDEMGTLDTGGTGVILVALAIRCALFVLFCALVYVVGRAVVGA